VHTCLGRRAEREAETAVDSCHDRHRVGDELAIMDIVEVVRVTVPGFLQLGYVMQAHLQPRTARFSRLPQISRDDFGEAGARAHGFDRVAVGDDDACVGKHVEQSLHGSGVARILQQPRLAVVFLHPDQPQVVRVTSVGGCFVLLEEPCAVARQGKGGNEGHRDEALAHHVDALFRQLDLDVVS
jgi:hypothetical protein